MDHNETRHRLSEYIDNAVAPAERAQIDAHLAECRECSDALRELRLTIEQVKTVEEVDAPAWMTSKIMAKVREETEKKSFIERFFLPLSAKLPIQAVAVLFLTITVFYIYRSNQPVPAPSEAPVREFAAEKSAPKDQLARRDAVEPQAKKAPQKPEFKALDMKQEYEAPAPPAPAAGAAATAPAFAKPDRQALPSTEAAKTGNGYAAPQAEAPAATGLMERHLALSDKKEAAVPTKKQESDAQMEKGPVRAAAKAKVMAAQKEPVNALSLTIKVKELGSAEKEIKKAAAALGATIVKTQPSDGGSEITLMIASEKSGELLTKLNTIGSVKGKTPPRSGSEGLLTIRITMTKE